MCIRDRVWTLQTFCFRTPIALLYSPDRSGYKKFLERSCNQPDCGRYDLLYRVHALRWICRRNNFSGFFVQSDGKGQCENGDCYFKCYFWIGTSFKSCKWQRRCSCGKSVSGHRCDCYWLCICYLILSWGKYTALHDYPFLDQYDQCLCE